jgi:hypothetical protein
MVVIIKIILQLVYFIKFHILQWYSTRVSTALFLEEKRCHYSRSYRVRKGGKGVSLLLALWDPILFFRLSTSRSKLLFFYLIIIYGFIFVTNVIIRHCLTKMLFALCAWNERIKGWPCLSVHIIQLVNRWTDLDEIWHRRYTSDVHPKIMRFNFLRSVIPTWRANGLAMRNQH